MSRKSALFWVLLCVGLLAVAAISVAHLRKGKVTPLGQAPRIEYPSETMTQLARQEFLQGSFSFIKDMQDLPPSVVGAFTEQGVPAW